MSTIKADAFQSSTGTQNVSQTTLFSGTAKAWCDFGLDTTAAINDSYGISSLTDLGVGNPQLNLSNALASSAGAATCTGSLWTTGSTAALQSGAHISSASAVVLRCGSDTDAAVGDWDQGYSTVHGDLA